MRCCTPMLDLARRDGARAAEPWPNQAKPPPSGASAGRVWRGSDCPDSLESRVKTLEECTRDDQNTTITHDRYAGSVYWATSSVELTVRAELVQQLAELLSRDLRLGERRYERLRLLCRLGQQIAKLCHLEVVQALLLEITVVGGQPRGRQGVRATASCGDTLRAHPRTCVTMSTDLNLSVRLTYSCVLRKLLPHHRGRTAQRVQGGRGASSSCARAAHTSSAAALGTPSFCARGPGGPPS